MIARLSIWAPAVAQMAAIFYLSSQESLPSLPGGLTDYTGHFIGYAILGALLLRGFSGGRLSGVNARTAAFAIIGASAYGISDEWHQTFVPGRTATVTDWLADTLGATVSVLAVMAVARAAARKRGGRDV